MARAVAAAVAVAAEQGLPAPDAVAVGTGSNVIVHLRPAPVVARVMTGTVVLHDDPEAWLRRELDVCAFLAARGAPVVAPAGGVDPGPFERDGLWLSLWAHAEVTGAPVGGGAMGAALRALHDTLAAYPGAGDLPPRAAVLDELAFLLGAVAEDPEAEALAAERDALAPFLAAPVAGAQPIHGDASVGNLLVTAAGPRWNDFEDVCVGAPAWDLVGLVDDARHRHGDAFAAEVVAGHGGALPGTEEQDLILRAHTLYGRAWRLYRAHAA